MRLAICKRNRHFFSRRAYSEEFEEAKHLIRDEVCVKRAKHAVYEVSALSPPSSLERRRYYKVRELMNQSHVSLRDDYEVSCKEIDLLVDLSWNTPRSHRLSYFTGADSAAVPSAL